MYYAPDGEDGYTRSPPESVFLWGQAVFIIAQLLTAGLLHINELDTIRRYLPSYNRPRKGGRYSAFQVWNWFLHILPHSKRLFNKILLVKGSTHYYLIQKKDQTNCAIIHFEIKSLFKSFHAAGKTRGYCKFLPFCP